MTARLLMKHCSIDNVSLSYPVHLARELHPYIYQSSSTTIKAVNTQIERIENTGIRRKPREPDKVEVFCRLAEAAVAEGVIFEGNKIIEILPW